jgi:hypothetical protein
VQRSLLAALVDQYSLVSAIGDDINVWLRVVDDDVWPLDAASRVGPLVAAIDMAGDPVDDRSVDAALPIIERYL